MNNTLYFYRQLSFLFFLIILNLNISYAQSGDYIAIVPTFHDRLNASQIEGTLQLKRQQFLLFVYRNAVAVYSEADFINNGTDTIAQELALPSTSHDENGDEPGGRISNGILSVKLWIEGEPIGTEVVNDNDGDWYTIQAQFPPGEERKVKSLFWAQTSLTDIDSLPGLDTAKIKLDQRGFMIDLDHASAWNNVIESIDIQAVLQGGLAIGPDSFQITPDTYEIQDSILTWSFTNIEPSANGNILVMYKPSGNWQSTTNTMAKLSAYIVKKVYDKLINYSDQLYNN